MRNLLPDESDAVGAPAALNPNDLLNLSVIEQVLYGDEFRLTVRQRTFCDALHEHGYDPQRAYAAAFPEDAKKGVRHVRGRTKQIMGSKGVSTYIKWRQSQLALRAAVTDSELFEKERVVYLQAVGALRQQESFVKFDKKGKPVTHDVQVYKPSAQAANSAVSCWTSFGRLRASVQGPLIDQASNHIVSDAR